MARTRQIRIQTPGDPPIASGELVEVQGVGLCVADATGKVVPLGAEEVLRLRTENERLTELLSDVGGSWREFSHSGRAKDLDDKYGFLASLNAALAFYEQRLFAEDDE